MFNALGRPSTSTYLPLLSDRLVQRIFRIRSTQERLYTQQDRSYLQRRAPVVLQHIQAYAPKSVDVRVIDAGEKADARRAHGVVVGKEEFEMENTAC